jgi:pyruvate-formate lyase-activating enzyme
MIYKLPSETTVLFLGNNDQSTHDVVSGQAQAHQVINHGLLQNPEFVPAEPGYYHTTVVDIPWGGLLTLASRFDRIVMLDQPRDQWSHWKCLQATCKLMMKLEELGKKTLFRHNQNVQQILYWMDLVYKKNSSFCLYPWINVSNDGSRVKLCARDVGTVTTVEKLQDWKSDESFGEIRQAMLSGQKIPDHCRVCYDYEDKGMESYRQFETLDWALQLDLKDVRDLDSIARPYFYEVHTGNHCNIKCRGCQPTFSEPIGREIAKFNIKMPAYYRTKPQYFPIDRIDIDHLDQKSSVYFQGGEPTIMPEVRDFMQRCIEKNRTDFFLTMCTNGVRLPQEFLDLVQYFSNVNFSFSIDGYKQINDYWRWGSSWRKVIDNARRVIDLGYNLSINTVPGIYNVTNLHLLMEFLDREFPFTAVYMQVNYHPDQSAYNHPMADLVLDSMRRCQQTSIYHSNGKSCKTSIDSIYAHYSNNPQCNLEHLKSFFDYNDQLDLVRQSKLADYIPELELARSYLAQ